MRDCESADLAAEAFDDAERERALLGRVPDEDDVDPRIRHPSDWAAVYVDQGTVFVDFYAFGVRRGPVVGKLKGAFCPIGADPNRACAIVPGASRVRNAD